MLDVTGTLDTERLELDRELDDAPDKVADGEAVAG